MATTYLDLDTSTPLGRANRRAIDLRGDLLSHACIEGNTCARDLLSGSISFLADCLRLAEAVNLRSELEDNPVLDETILGEELEKEERRVWDDWGRVEFGEVLISSLEPAYNAEILGDEITADQLDELYSCAKDREWCWDHLDVTDFFPDQLLSEIPETEIHRILEEPLKRAKYPEVDIAGLMCRLVPEPFALDDLAVSTDGASILARPLREGDAFDAPPTNEVESVIRSHLTKGGDSSRIRLNAGRLQYLLEIMAYREDDEIELEIVTSANSASPFVRLTRTGEKKGFIAKGILLAIGES